MLIAAACAHPVVGDGPPPSTNPPKASPAGAVTTNRVANSHRVRGLAQCAPNLPTTPAAALNPGVPGLAGSLVPLTALNVRVCRYLNNGLVGTGLLRPAISARLEQQANRLRRLPINDPQALCGIDGVGGSGTSFNMTFADDTRRVTIRVVPTCGSAAPTTTTNGVRSLEPTTRWLTALQHYTALRLTPNHSGKGPQGPTGVPLR